MTKRISTFERKLKNPKFRKAFNKGYRKLLKDEEKIRKHPTLLEVAYEMAIALYEAGIIDEVEMREYEELCFPKKINSK